MCYCISQCNFSQREKNCMRNLETFAIVIAFVSVSVRLVERQKCLRIKYENAFGLFMKFIINGFAANNCQWAEQWRKWVQIVEWNNRWENGNTVKWTSVFFHCWTKTSHQPATLTVLQILYFFSFFEIDLRTWKYSAEMMNKWISNARSIIAQRLDWLTFPFRKDSNWIVIKIN